MKKQQGEDCRLNSRERFLFLSSSVDEAVKFRPIIEHNEQLLYTRSEIMKKKNEQTTRTRNRWCALRQSAVVMKNIDEEEEERKKTTANI